MQTTKNRIIAYIKEHKQASAKELTVVLGISSRAVFKQLSQLISSGVLAKVGKPPKVYYKIPPEIDAIVDFADIPPASSDLIQKEFITITPDGKYLEGMVAFKQWCIARNFDIQRKAIEFQQIYQKYAPLKKTGFIDGMEKFKKTYARVWIDEIYYLDFYSIEIFGKTKLGQKLLYAKQSQNKKIIDDLVKEISPRVHDLVLKENIDCVGFIPPTVKRDIQLMREIENGLNLKVNKLKIVKIKTDIIVPQKTLNKLEDRIKNAEQTFIVDETEKRSNILLIDDAVGSGATLNQVAKAIKDKKLVLGKVVGLSITGSLKGFDVISEV